jgi:predicted transcriptional regulator
MLFIESKTSEQSVDGAARLLLLEKLQEKGLIPLIRSARLSCYELALMGTEQVKEMERAVALWMETEDNSLYTRGDLFCVDDFVLFLVFGGTQDEVMGMRAGIVYGIETRDANTKLDTFCRNVQEALDHARGEGSEEGSAQGLIEDRWERREPASVSIFERTDVIGGNGSPGGRRTGAVERALALEALEDADARRLLRRIREAQTEGRAADLLASEGDGTTTQTLINRLSDVGLLRREMLVSCRKEERALFRLPSPDALAVITASSAVCSECGAAVADEKVVELIASTELAAELLEHVAWLTSGVRSVLNELGIPDEQISAGSAYSDSEANLMVNVCHEPFLFYLREGDLTGAQAARALDKLIATKARHLVFIATGKVQDEGRVRLREYARRRAQGGNDIEVILIEGVDSAAAELQHAFERVSQRALVAELCQLDASLGFSAGYMVFTRFRLKKAGALKDLAESAVGALAGSLGGI